MEQEILKYGDYLLIDYADLDKAGYCVIVMVDMDDCRLISLPSMNRYMEENIYGWTLEDLKLYLEDNVAKVDNVNLQFVLWEENKDA